MADSVVAYVTPTRVSSPLGCSKKGGLLVEAGFFTRDPDGTYHHGLNTRIVFTQADMQVREKYGSAKRVSTELPLTNGQRVWTDITGAFYIACSDRDTNRLRIA